MPAQPAVLPTSINTLNFRLESFLNLHIDAFDDAGVRLGKHFSYLLGPFRGFHGLFLTLFQILTNTFFHIDQCATIYSLLKLGF